MEKKEVVVIRSFNSANEAHLHKALLESAGIQARVKSDIAVQVVYGGFTQVDLLVAAEDEQRAKEILAAKFDEEEFAEETHTKRKKVK